jgi:hypothetical protein
MARLLQATRSVTSVGDEKPAFTAWDALQLVMTTHYLRAACGSAPFAASEERILKARVR